jgi:rod shape-determining protein MreB
MGFFDFLTEEIAIDLGTANTLIIHADKVVVDSPSIVARDRITGKIIAVGKEANMMQGKTHENIKTIRPLKDGVIADFDASEKMINMFIKNIPALKKKMVPTRIKDGNMYSFRDYRGRNACSKGICRAGKWQGSLPHT